MRCLILKPSSLCVGSSAHFVVDMSDCFKVDVFFIIDTIYTGAIISNIVSRLCKKKLGFDPGDKAGDEVLDDELVQFVFILVIVHHVDGDESVQQ